MSKQDLLILTSSFPFTEDNTSGVFVLDYARHMKPYYNPIVLTHNIKSFAMASEIDGIEIQRFDFNLLPSLDHHFEFGPLSAFKSSKRLRYLVAPLYIINQFRALRSIVKTRNIKLIHAHWSLPQGLVTALAKYFLPKDVKVLNTVHGGDIDAFGGGLAMRLNKFVFNQVDAVTVVSSFIEQQLNERTQDKFKDKFHVAPMGIDTQRFEPSAADPSLRTSLNINGPFLLFVGRLVEKKGITYVLQAMPKILESFPETKLLIVGSGPLENELKQEVQDLQLAENVIFYGTVEHSDLPSYFAEADIFIGPSIVTDSGDKEGFGLVFAEAAATETLVVTSDFEAMQDIIIDGETGLTVPQKDADAIAEVITKSLANPESVAAIPKKGRQHVVDNFDWRSIAKKYAEILKGISE